MSELGRGHTATVEIYSTPLNTVSQQMELKANYVGQL